MSQPNSKTVWSSEDGDLRKKQPPPASSKYDTESLDDIKKIRCRIWGRCPKGGGAAATADGIFAS